MESKTMTMTVPKILRMAIRKHAAENDRGMGEEVRVVLANHYGITLEVKPKSKKA